MKQKRLHHHILKCPVKYGSIKKYGNPGARDTTHTVSFTLVSHTYLVLHSMHVYYLSSISWSLLWAASISMQEPSVSDRGAVEDGCSKARFCSAWCGCGAAGLACCAGRGGQLFAGGQSTWPTALEFSEMSTSVSTINRLLLALHPLRKKEDTDQFAQVGLFHVYFKCKCHQTYSSSTLLLCFLRHLVSQLLWDKESDVSRRTARHAMTWL